VYVRAERNFRHATWTFSTLDTHGQTGNSYLSVLIFTISLCFGKLFG
jgi:hypothetical protein